MRKWLFLYFIKPKEAYTEIFYIMQVACGIEVLSVCQTCFRIFLGYYVLTVHWIPEKIESLASNGFYFCIHDLMQILSTLNEKWLDNPETTGV